MKRIALVIIIIIVVPVWIVSCNPCGIKDYPKFRTYSKIENQIFKNDMTGFHHENDTLMNDTIRGIIRLQSNYFSILEKQNGYNCYSAIACEPAEPKEKNPIRNFLFGIAINGNINNQDTTLLKSLNLKINGYKWPMEKDMFFTDFDREEFPYIIFNIFSPHNSKDIQFVTWAIKENGDTLKAISQKVFCK